MSELEQGTSPAEPATPVVEAAPAPEATPQTVEPSQEAPHLSQEQSDRFTKLAETPVSEWNLSSDELNNPQFLDTLETMRKERLMQADYTRKTQELAEQKKALWDPISRQFTADDINTLLQNPYFTQQANALLAQEQANQQTQQQEEYLTEEGRAIQEQKQQLSQVQQDLMAQKQFIYNQKLDAELNKLDERFNGQASKMRDTIEQLRVQAANPQVGLSPEGAYKALNYDQAVKEAYERGKKEGMGVKQQKINNQPLLNATPTTSGGQPTALSFDEARNQVTQLFHGG